MWLSHWVELEGTLGAVVAEAAVQRAVRGMVLAVTVTLPVSSVPQRTFAVPIPKPPRSSVGVTASASSLCASDPSSSR